MNRSRKIAVQALFYLSFFGACTEQTLFVPLLQIDDKGQPFVDLFLEEANKRGIEIPMDNLVLELTAFEDDEAAVACGRSFGALNNQQQNYIRIDTLCMAWQYNSFSREILIFHELGHTHLLRPHINETLPNGDFKSIMKGGDWNILDFYVEDQTKRQYYLDELFDINTPVPSWAQ